MNLVAGFRGLGLLPIVKDAYYVCAGIGSGFRQGKTTLENEVKDAAQFWLCRH